MKVRKLLAMLLVLTMVLSITLPTAVLAVEGDDAGATVTQTTESTQPDEGGDTATVPDEGDDTATVPDEGGDTATVPDEGGDTATVPDEGGDTTTVPDEGTDSTPAPSESADPTPAPSESADPTPAPSESADPTPVPSESTDPTPVPSESADPTPVPSESTDPTPVPSESADPTPVPSESTDPTPKPSESTVPAPTETVEIPETTVPGAALCEHGNDPATCPDCHPELYCEHGVLLTEECAQCIAAQQAHEAAMVVAKSVYEKIMAAKTLEEYAAAKVVDPMYQSSIDALLAEYVATLTEDQQAAYDGKIAELEALVPPVLSFETVEEIYAAIMAAETKADYDAILAAISDEQKAELEAYVLTLTEEEQAAYAKKVAALTAPLTDVEALFEAFMAAETYEEYDALFNSLTEEQIEAVRTGLPEDKMAQLLEKEAALVEAHRAELQAEEELAPTVNYDDVARIEDAQSVTAIATPMSRMMSVQTMMMRAYSANSPTTYADDGEEGLHLNKTVTTLSEGRYQITLEAWTDGVVTAGEAKPTDIVLVVDMSTSMNEDFSSEGYHYTEVYKDNLSTNNDYYVYVWVQGMWGSGSYQYVEVHWCTTCKAWTNCTSGWFGSHNKGNEYTPKTSANDNDSDHVQFYSREHVAEMSRLDALKQAASSFIGQVADQATDDRIAIVGFGQSAYYLSGNAYDGYLLDATANERALINAINNIGNGNPNLEGATEHGKGLEAAEAILSQAETETNRNKVVIMLTDGEPAPKSTDNWSSRVVKQAINSAYDLKNVDGAAVYTISVMPGSDAENPTQPMDRFMSYISSNYPQAQYTGRNLDDRSNSGNSYYSQGGNTNGQNNILNQITPGQQNTASGSFYLTAGDIDTLESIFGQIGDQIENPSVELGANASVRDTLTPYFDLPENTSDVTVQTAAYNGSSFGTPTVDTGVTVNFEPGTEGEDGGTVVVTGFDFDSNYVTDEAKTDGTYGKKLIITFTITPDPDFWGGNQVPTNVEADSGVMTGQGNMAGTFPVPDPVHVPLKDISVTAKDLNLYYGSSLPTADSDYYDRLTTQPDNWQTDYVNEIEYTVTRPSGTTEDGTFTVTATMEPTYEGRYEAKTASDTGNTYVYTPSFPVQDINVYLTNPVTLGGSVNEEDVTWKHGDTLSTEVTMTGSAPAISYTAVAGEEAAGSDYYVDVTSVTYDYNGSIGTIPAGKYSAIRGNCTLPSCNFDQSKGDFMVHVFTPEITWKDSKKDYGETLTQTLLESHKVGDVVWKHNNTLSTAEGVTVSGNAPTLSYSFADANGGTLKTLQAETHVKVTVTANGQDITTSTNFVWSDAGECDCTIEKDGDPNNANPAYQFRIHLNNFDLTVTKDVSTAYDSDDNFLFTLYQDGKVYATFTLRDNESVTFKNLQAGYEYRVVESVGEDSWSWRYTCDNADQKVTDIQNGTAKLTFTNTLSEDQWLSDEARAENDFNASAGIGVNARMGAALVPEKPKMPGDQDADNEERS